MKKDLNNSYFPFRNKKAFENAKPRLTLQQKNRVLVNVSNDIAKTIKTKKD